jgi:hypothetical protein
MTASHAADDRAPPRHWIGVVSREHVLMAVAGGYALLNRGMLAPLQRLSPDDWLICYSPRTTYPDGAPLQVLTAIGRVSGRAPYEAPMPTGAMGHHRDIDWCEATETPIAKLNDRLEFTRGNWGMLTRRGLFDISAADFQTIRGTMTTS